MEDGFRGRDQQQGGRWVSGMIAHAVLVHPFVPLYCLECLSHGPSPPSLPPGSLPRLFHKPRCPALCSSELDAYPNLSIY